MQNTPSKLVPALIGGGIMGLLSAIPFINFGNCLCCMWVLLGGFTAAYFYSRDLPPEMEFTGGDAAVVGLLAGLFGALFGTLLGYMFMLVLGSMPMESVLEAIRDSDSDIPPEMEDFLENFMEGGRMGAFFLVGQLFFDGIRNIIFGALGGLLGKAAFGKKPAPVKR